MVERKVQQESENEKENSKYDNEGNKAYPTGEEDVSKDNEIRGILKTIDQRSLTKKKKVPNQ